MIIKRKLYTRQETKAMKEMYQALKKGNIGRGLSTKKFVKARHVSNETIDALTGKGQVVDYAKNSQAINDIGLPETAKAYKRMMEKYTNPELHERFKRIQAASSNNRLRELRAKLKNEIPEEDYKNTLKELEEVKKDRSGKSYKIKREFVDPNSKENLKEKKELAVKYNQAHYLTKGDKNNNPELAQKIIKDLKKKNIRFVKNPNPEKGNFYKPITKEIHLVNRKRPATILHENGHRLSITKRETRPQYHSYDKKLDDTKNTSKNLNESIMNKVGDLSTLTEEANASYHQAAQQGKIYKDTKEQLKSGNKHLDNAIRTYELDRAIKQLDNEQRKNLGKLRNK